ncbi:hypothetical protein DLD99_21445 [Pseudomonas kribbensis]|uniref:Uncharacterized protein n=1 Tax=Pseudomonas kribbensis TaxID=1628086 RepID=A0A345RUG7_9PSED|nr:hypothetical protein [Pseudomonas kribbensis]AXI62933.1 hypothetical protein DLD99_21445 [Pseudomonas kribbensis]
MTDKFEEFIRKQNELSGDGDQGLDLQTEKDMWFAKLNELYALVSDSLKEYTSANLAKIDFRDIAMTEELIGAYTMQEAQISLGRQIVKLTPIGTFLIGARGRVDMKGPRGMARFLIVPPDSREPRIRVTFGDTPAVADPVAPPETWVWKIATAPPRVTYIDLTKESFREALMGVVNG